MTAVVTLILAGCYSLLALLCFRILHRPWPKRNAVNKPTISIVVACRNEAENLPACLASLAGLTWPHDRLQIILVDDASRDHSAALLHEFAGRHSHARVIELARDKKALPGKAGAVLEGVAGSSGEFIFLTDADCTVPSTWIETHLAYFHDNVGLVGGFTLLDGRGWLAQVQSLDWLFLLSVASAASRIGRPLSWMGNNLAFRKSLYDTLGGYRSLGPSLVEDFSLINAVAKQTQWRIILHNDSAAVVHSRPEKNMRSLYEQRKRWALGVRPVHPLGKWLILLSGCSRLAILAAAFYSWPVALGSLLTILLADTLILSYNMQRLQRHELLPHIPGFEGYFYLLVLVMPLAFVLDRTIIWKEERYPAS